MIDTAKLAGGAVKVLDAAKLESWSPGDLLITAHPEGQVFIWQVNPGENHNLVACVPCLADALALIETVELRAGPRDDAEVMKEQMERRQRIFVGEEARVATRNRILEQLRHRRDRTQRTSRESSQSAHGLKSRQGSGRGRWRW